MAVGLTFCVDYSTLWNKTISSRLLITMLQVLCTVENGLIWHSRKDRGLIIDVTLIVLSAPSTFAMWSAVVPQAMVRTSKFKVATKG